MGYYTTYNLKASGREQEIWNAIEDGELTSGYQWENYGTGWSMPECKWYDHNDDMLAISRKWPDVLFKLTGEGEESGDLWCAYYLAGKSQKIQGVITYADPDPYFTAPEIIPDPVDEEKEAWLKLGKEKGWLDEE